VSQLIYSIFDGTRSLPPVTINKNIVLHTFIFLIKSYHVVKHTLRGLLRTGLPDETNTNLQGGDEASVDF
jgi:hypothetical protein